MKKISAKTTLQELAVIVCDGLRQAGIEAVLTGGAVVSIYTKNEYQSWDLDFITHAPAKDTASVMKDLGFKKEGRHYVHSKTKFFVEFPTPPLSIGDEPVTDWKTKRTKAGVLYLLNPTECVMDRLAGYYHWNDKQSLEQAVMVARAHPVDIRKIRNWSKREGHSQRYIEFQTRLKTNNAHTTSK